jgi:MFS family permease
MKASRGPFRMVDDPRLRRSLSLSVIDAVLWSVMFGFSENYVVPFMLLCGASVFGVSLMQGLAQLANAIAQLTGSAIIQRRGSRRSFSRLSVAVHGLSWIFVFVAAWAHHTWLAILLFCAGLFASNLSNPSWLSWMNDLVPADRRGHFWGIRNRTGGVAQFIATSLAGLFLFTAKQRGLEMAAYGILMLLAFLSRSSDAFILQRMHEPPMARSTEARAMSLIVFLRDLRDTDLGGFMLYMIPMSFLTMMMAPLIQVHLLKDLGLDYVAFTAVTMTGTIATFLLMTYWGTLIDRFGNRRIIMVTSAFFPLIAAGWVFIRAWPILVLLQFLNGFLFAGYSLAGSTYIFDAVGRDRITKSLAYYQTLLMTAAFLGSLSGGAVAGLLERFGLRYGVLNAITGVFVIVAVLRLAVFLFLRNGFSEIRSTEPSPGVGYLLVIKPGQDIVRLFSRARDRVRRGGGRDSS